MYFQTSLDFEQDFNQFHEAWVTVKTGGRFCSELKKEVAVLCQRRQFGDWGWGGQEGICAKTHKIYPAPYHSVHLKDILVKKIVF